MIAPTLYFKALNPASVYSQDLDRHFYRVSLFFIQTLFFMCLQYKSLKNTVGKGEIALNEQFLLFPTEFSTFLESFPPFSSNLKLSTVLSLSSEEAKICYLGNG